MLKLIYKSLIISVFISLLCSCSDIREMKSDIDDLKSRTTAAETQINNLNNNIDAIQKLLEASTINSVKDLSDGYELILSNGSVIKLTNGIDGQSITPVLSIDSEGYWKVDYLDGKGQVYLTYNGNKVKGLGSDGNTPVFGVDKDNYWMIDFGKGQEYVLDASGNKVKATTAVASGNPYFDSVIYDESQGIMTITLKDEAKTVLTIPVVSNFMFSISGVDNVQIFSLGESRQFDITKQNVSTFSYFAPKGWKISIAESIITVTAPESIEETKATLADTKTDVSFIAYYSSGNYATLAKIKVSLDATVTHNPNATVYAGEEATTTALDFQIVLSDATAYKYILKKSSETAPTIEELKESGIEGTATTLNINNLEENTDYTIYVLAYYEGKAGASLSTLSLKTQRTVFATYYEAYSAGQDIVIGDISINKSVYGDGTLLTESTKSISKDGVFFIPDNITAIIPSSTRSNLIIIGNNPNSRSNIQMTGKRINFDAANNGNFMLFNINFKLTTDDGLGNVLFYPSSPTGGNLDKIIFNNCLLDLSGLQGLSFSAATETAHIGINKVDIQDCDINVGPTDRFTYFFQYRKYGEITQATMKNNIIWSASETNKTRFFNLSQSTKAADYINASPITNLVFSNNTVINCRPSTYNIVKSVNSLVIKDNLFYAKITSYTPFIFYDDVNYPISSGEVSGNAGYNKGTGTVRWKAVNANTIFGHTSVFTLLQEDPFTGGTFDITNGAFVPNSNFSSIGAQR